MSLKEQLQQDLHQAMRTHDERRKLALRLVLTAVQIAEARQRTLSDEQVLELIRREVKRREEALELVLLSGRQDLLAQDKAELEILRAYLPQELSAEDLQALAQVAIAEVGAASPADLGKVMKVLMPQVKGRADGQLVNQIVRTLLVA